MMDSHVLVNEAVDDYTGRGWSIIPIRTGDKRPLVRWEEFQYRRPDVDEVHAWFSRWPEAGIGIVTGAVSGLVVIDVDPRHGGDASLERLEHQYDRLPSTVESHSGGGGRHLYFAHPGGLVRNKVGLAPGVDLRRTRLPIRLQSLILCRPQDAQGVVEEAAVARAAVTRQRLLLLRRKNR